jgi:hypothetical protein
MLPLSTSATPPEVAQAIAAGDSLELTKAALKAADAPFIEGGLALSRVEDRGNLLCTIDDTTSAAIFYSQSKRVVTGISLVFRPNRKSPRLHHTWIDARSITFEPDGSYRVHFASPKRER